MKNYKTNKLIQLEVKMNSIIALEDLIKQNEARVKLQQRQLADHEAGVQKLSRVGKASAETNLDAANELVTKYKGMLEELQKHDIEELEEKQRLEAAIKRKKYFDNQSSRIESHSKASEDEKLEAMMIMDELPAEVNFEDKEKFVIASKSIELSITNHKELFEKLSTIRQDFENLTKNENEANITDLGMLNLQIPILVLHFFILLTNIKENIDKENLAKKEAQKKKDSKEEIKEVHFVGFPKYEDWWIHELWGSHQAYFALYKWKSIINNLCATKDQKRAWSDIFDNWIFIKKMLNVKGELAFDFSYAFD